MTSLENRAQVVADGAPGTQRQWDDMLTRWSHMNHFVRTPTQFSLCALAEGRGIGGRQLLHQWPARDHETYYHWKRHTVAIVTEPYLGSGLADLVKLVEILGLEMHTPPNPLASLWYPGSTAFCVITRRDWQVRWLPEQLVFTGGLDETFVDGTTAREVLEGAGIRVEP
jgi:hypothetical protein